MGMSLYKWFDSPRLYGVDILTITEELPVFVGSSLRFTL